MIWNQNYDPLGWWPLSTLVSALPVVTLFFVLLVLRKRVWVSALCGFVMAVALAGAVFRMPAPMIAPMPMAVASNSDSVARSVRESAFISSRTNFIIEAA